MRANGLLAKRRSSIGWTTGRNAAKPSAAIPLTARPTLTTDAVDRGAFGSPTFFVGNEMFFGKDQLRDVEESIVEQTSQAISKTA